MRQRFIFLSVLGLLELVALSVRVDTPTETTGWISFLANADVVARIGIVFVAAAGFQLLQLAPDPAFDLPADRRWFGWLAAHLALFAPFLALAPRAMAAPLLGQPVALTWLALGSMSAVALAFCFSRPVLLVDLIRRHFRLCLSSLVAALAAWLLGKALQQLWQPLSEATFWTTHQLLKLTTLDTAYWPDRGIIGTDRFVVEVAPQCSGYEGIGLIIVFVSLYLFLFRKDTRLPNALLLYPLGIAAIYLANSVRLAALILLGHFFSAADSISGFHSQAGWTFFTVLSLGLLTAGRRSPFFSTLARSETGTPVRLQQAAALLVPLLVLLGSGMVASMISAGARLADPLVIVVTVAALWRYRAIYRTLAWSWSWQSVAVGFAVFVVWCVLVQGDPAEDAGRNAVVRGMSDLTAFSWIVCRLIRSVLIVPVVEELAFRGYLLRKLVSRDFDSVPFERVTLSALVVSSALFGLLHPDWRAGMLAGAAYAFAQRQSRSIGGAIAAHGVSNGLIALVVLTQGRWSLWP